MITRRARYTRRKRMAEINVVPYIDVMLVLLVIFMVTAPLLTQGVEVRLPQVSAEPVPSKDSPPLVVTVNQSGVVYFSGSDRPKNPVSHDDLATMLKSAQAKAPGQPIYLKGDEAVPYGEVAKVMVILQNAGVLDIGLITDPSPQKSS